MNIRTRQMNIEDIESVVKIHQSAFKGFFLDQIGPMFLKKYYMYSLKYNGSIALVSYDNDKKITGFCVGFLNPAKFYNFFYSHKIELIPSILIGFIRKPIILINIIRNIFRVNNERKTVLNDNQYELASIGVKTNTKGIGSILLKQFIKSVENTDSKKIVLTTNKYNNENVHIFYQKHGFLKKKDIIRGERTLTEFIYKIPK